MNAVDTFNQSTDICGGNKGMIISMRSQSLNSDLYQMKQKCTKKDKKKIQK